MGVGVGAGMGEETLDTYSQCFCFVFFEKKFSFCIYLLCIWEEEDAANWMWCRVSVEGGASLGCTASSL